MSQENHGATKTFPCTNALSQYARVVMNGATLDVASATQPELGTLTEAAFSVTTAVNKAVRVRSAQGTAKFIANGAITQYASVYAAASGKISATGTIKIGIALDAASNDGDVVEVLRAGAGDTAPVSGVAAGYRIARGQLTTVTAADTVVTGLTTVVSVVASMDDNPGDDPMLVSATIGDQVTTPVAGSVIIKTWKNTGGTDPTPLAATTFTKKVNWIAIGT